MTISVELTPWWGNFKKVKCPSQTQIYQETARIIRDRYLDGQNNVLECYAKAVAENGLKYGAKTIASVFLALNLLRSKSLSQSILKRP